MTSIRRALVRLLERCVGRRRAERLRGRWIRWRMKLAGLSGTRPVRGGFGWGAGQCVDRRYVEGFLARHRDDVRGRVLEVGDDRYTRRFGDGDVRRSVVLHRDPGKPGTTVVGDLRRGGGLAGGSLDCVILTQTLQFIYDVRAAIDSTARLLRPGGVVLATVPGVAQLDGQDMAKWGEYWRFTGQSARRLFSETFGPDAVEVESHGNVLAATALLQGIVSEELPERALDETDPLYPVVVTVHARKTEGAVRG